jgi:glucosylceramidase
MKTNGDYSGFGFLKSEYYQTWADYLVKWVTELWSATSEFHIPCVKCISSIVLCSGCGNFNGTIKINTDPFCYFICLIIITFVLECVY